MLHFVRMETRAYEFDPSTSRNHISDITIDQGSLENTGVATANGARALDENRRVSMLWFQLAEVNIDHIIIAHTSMHWKKPGICLERHK